MAEVSASEAPGFITQQVGDSDRILFGFPAMGNEVLEKSKFDPMFTDIEKALPGNKNVLPGSYGWGDGHRSQAGLGGEAPCSLHRAGHCLDSKRAERQMEQHLHLHGSVFGAFPAARTETEAEIVADYRKK